METRPITPSHQTVEVPDHRPALARLVMQNPVSQPGVRRVVGVAPMNCGSLMLWQEPSSHL
jgi:hypothetical protein